MIEIVEEKDAIQPIPDVTVCYRLFEPEDLPFVADSWVKSYRSRVVYTGVMNTLYSIGHNKLINVLKRFCKVVVACDQARPSYIIGWACARVNKQGVFELHYVYVKDTYRQMGVATAILKHLGYREGSVIMCSHWNRLARDIFSTRDYIEYNPYLIHLGAEDV